MSGKFKSPHSAKKKLSKVFALQPQTMTEAQQKTSPQKLKKKTERKNFLRGPVAIIILVATAT